MTKPLPKAKANPGTPEYHEALADDIKTSYVEREARRAEAGPLTTTDRWVCSRFVHPFTYQLVDLCTESINWSERVDTFWKPIRDSMSGGAGSFHVKQDCPPEYDGQSYFYDVRGNFLFIRELGKAPNIRAGNLRAGEVALHWKERMTDEDVLYLREGQRKRGVLLKKEGHYSDKPTKARKTAGEQRLALDSELQDYIRAIIRRPGPSAQEKGMLF